MPPEEGLVLPKRRILIAEDSSVTRDLLKLVLVQRGHDVDLVSDGVEALERLQTLTYDVALLDFHLPKLTGLKVAKEFVVGLKGEARRPRLIAMTADVEGLLSDPDNCEIFDFTVPKPLDIYSIGDVVESEEPVLRRPELRNAAPRSEEAGASEALALPSRKRTDFIESLGISFLHWPDDFSPKRLATQNWTSVIAEEHADAILVRDRADLSALEAIWRVKPLHLLPIIDLAGSLGARADVNSAEISADHSDSVRELTRAFHARRADIHPDFLHSDELDEKLLARVAVAGGRLKASRAPDAREYVSFNACLAVEALRRESQKLVGSGFLKPVFYDRLHVCAQCGSSRLIVREECRNCRSTHLQEAPYLHHFKCAYQGPESDFRSGDEFICPKCRRTLTHFGVDYDKPGVVLVCQACAHSASESVVAFSCVDCGARAAADVIETRDVFSYELTDRGRAFLEAGRAYLGHAERSLRFAEFPLDLVVALNAEARRYNDDMTPFTLVNIGYQNLRPLEREAGHRQVSQARELFLENFKNALATESIIVRGQYCDFALLKGEQRDAASRRLNSLCEEAARTLRLNLGVVAQAYGPEDFV